MPMEATRSSVQSLELDDDQKRASHSMSNLHVNYWAKARSKVPSTNEGEYRTVEGNGKHQNKQII